MRPFLTFLALTDELRSCYRIPIRDDNITEPDEEFTVRLEPIPSITADNVEFVIPEAIITIVDDDGGALYCLITK